MTLKEALIARDNGDYTSSTLKLFSDAWEESRTLQAYCEFLCFQRVLGKPITSDQYNHLVDYFFKSKKRPYVYEFSLKRRLQNLCLEYEALNNINKHCALTNNRPSAGVFPFSRQKKCIAKIRENQNEWREQWIQSLLNDAHNGIAVVGNSATLLEKEKGKEIDSAGAVIRFNRPSEKASAKIHLGSHTHTRVLSPSYKGIIPPTDWIVISGPDMQYQLQNWSHIAPIVENNTPVITIPISFWRDLVEILHAPPSAGLLMLHYLRNHSELRPSLNAYGFGYDKNEKQEYHAIDTNHVPNNRHNWVKEAELLRDFFN